MGGAETKICTVSGLTDRPNYLTHRSGLLPSSWPSEDVPVERSAEKRTGGRVAKSVDSWKSIRPTYKKQKQKHQQRNVCQPMSIYMSVTLPFCVAFTVHLCVRSWQPAMKRSIPDHVPGHVLHFVIRRGVRICSMLGRIPTDQSNSAIVLRVEAAFHSAPREGRHIKPILE